MLKCNFLSLSLLLILLIFFSCDEAARPQIDSFTVTPEVASIGENYILSWSVTGAEQVSINNGIGTVSNSGDTTITAVSTGTITYTLTATNSTGSTTSSVSVIIQIQAQGTVIGGDGDDIGFFMTTSNDGGYLITGRTSSYV